MASEPRGAPSLLFGPQSSQSDERARRIERFVETLRRKSSTMVPPAPPAITRLAARDKARPVEPTPPTSRVRTLPRERPALLQSSRRVSVSSSGSEPEERPPKPQQQHVKRQSLGAPSADASVLEERRHRIAQIHSATQSRVRELQSKVREEEEMRRAAREAKEADELARDKEVLAVPKSRSFAAKLSSKQSSALRARASDRTSAADRHLRAHLLVRCGISPWRALIAQVRASEARATLFLAARLCRWAWLALSGYVRAQQRERAIELRRLCVMATAHHRTVLVRGVFREWKLLRRGVRARADAVRRQFGRYLVAKRAVCAWRMALELSRKSASQWYALSDSIAATSLRRRVWGRWRAFVEESSIDREARSKAARSWGKVQAMLYDQGQYQGIAKS